VNTTGRKCIECDAETVAIQIIDRGQRNIHYEMQLPYLWKKETYQ
jgi:hypothetical protein